MKIEKSSTEIDKVKSAYIEKGIIQYLRNNPVIKDANLERLRMETRKNLDACEKINKVMDQIKQQKEAMEEKKRKILSEINDDIEFIRKSIT